MDLYCRWQRKKADERKRERVCVYVFMCVKVCVREREIERESSKTTFLKSSKLSIDALNCLLNHYCFEFGLLSLYFQRKASELYKVLIFN